MDETITANEAMKISKMLKEQLPKADRQHTELLAAVNRVAIAVEQLVAAQRK